MQVSILVASEIVKNCDASNEKKKKKITNTVKNVPLPEYNTK